MLAELSALVILLGSSAFFSASETALTSISKQRLLQLKKNKFKNVKAISYLKENPGIMLATILIGNNLVNTAFTSLITIISVSIFWQYGIQNELIITPTTTFIATVLTLVFGEVLPKTIAMSSNKKLALTTAPIIVFLSKVFLPLVVIFNGLSNFCLKILGVKPLGKYTLVTEEEIIAMIEAGQESGSIAKEENKMLQDVLRFGDTLVGEVMTHLDNVVAVEENQTLPEILQIIKPRPHSRIPVYRDNKTNIIGLLYLKDLALHLGLVCGEEGPIIKKYPSLIRKPHIVYIDQKTSDILKQMRYHKVHIAVVKNREEKTVGLITIEDMIEEIVGEIHDEYEKN